MAYSGSGRVSDPLDQDLSEPGFSKRSQTQTSCHYAVDPEKLANALSLIPPMQPSIDMYLYHINMAREQILSRGGQLTRPVKAPTPDPDPECNPEYESPEQIEHAASEWDYWAREAEIWFSFILWRQERLEQSELESPPPTDPCECDPYLLHLELREYLNMCLNYSGNEEELLEEMIDVSVADIENRLRYLPTQLAKMRPSKRLARNSPSATSSTRSAKRSKKKKRSAAASTVNVNTTDPERHPSPSLPDSSSSMYSGVVSKRKRDENSMSPCNCGLETAKRQSYGESSRPSGACLDTSNDSTAKLTVGAASLNLTDQKEPARPETTAAIQETSISGAVAGSDSLAEIPRGKKRSLEAVYGLTATQIDGYASNEHDF